MQLSWKCPIIASAISLFFLIFRLGPWINQHILLVLILVVMHSFFASGDEIKFLKIEYQLMFYEEMYFFGMSENIFNLMTDSKWWFLDS